MAQNSCFAPECIKVPKVYDWVLLRSEIERSIPVDPDCQAAVLAQIAAGNIVTTQCTVLSSTVKVTNVTRQTVFFNGKFLDVGVATLLKTVNLIIAFFTTDPVTGVTIPVPGCLPITPTINITEKVALCFPLGLDISAVMPQIKTATCEAVEDFPTNNQITIDIVICQDVQVEKEVKLEILAQFCSPRANDIPISPITTGCEEPPFPAQCPDIFPRN